MNPFKKIFEEKLQSKKAIALAETVSELLEEINRPLPKGFVSPEKFKLHDRALDALLKHYGVKLTEDGLQIRINIREMKKDAHVGKKPIEEKIIPLLEGLYERYGVVHGNKVIFSVDPADFVGPAYYAHRAPKQQFNR